MNELLPALPSSLTSFIGLTICLGILIMLGTFFQEWAKTIYRHAKGTKEKRHDVRNEYLGFERRAENKGVEAAIMALVEQIKDNNVLIDRFITNWKEKVPDAIDAVEEIRRKQENNWERLFKDELPSLRHK